MVRRSALRGIRFEEGMTFGEDYDFWRQLAAKSNFAYVDQLLTCYRFHKGMTICSDPRKNLDAELEVQRRVLAMPEFQNLSRRSRACAYAAHGAKQSMRNRGSLTRSMIWRAIRTDPTYVTSYGLLALSLFSLRPLQYAISKRRRLIGNHIAADAGGTALEQEPRGEPWYSAGRHRHRRRGRRCRRGAYLWLRFSSSGKRLLRISASRSCCKSCSTVRSRTWNCIMWGFGSRPMPTRLVAFVGRRC